MKKMLMLASVASMIDQFNLPNIELLQEMGYEVHVACNFEKGSTCTEEKIKALKEKLKEKQVTYFQIDFNRNVLKLGDDFKAYQQVLRLCRKNRYEFLHCHSPIGGVVGRLVGHKTHTKVIYTAHGFHFYKGAPIQNWLIYYPIEKFLSRFTDVLITINKEDYDISNEKMKARKNIYVPGIGVDIDRFNIISDLELEEQNKNSEEVIMVSIGELSKRKNHEVIIKAIAQMEGIRPIKYFIVGKGELDEYLQNLINSYHLQDSIKLMGFCDNIPEILCKAHIFAFPSLQEGLPVALMEAMASGLPCVASRIRGNVDLLDNNGGILFTADSAEEAKNAIMTLVKHQEKRFEMGNYNKNKVKKYSIANVRKIMERIYTEITLSKESCN